jgi:hypothetical protein
MEDRLKNLHKSMTTTVMKDVKITDDFKYHILKQTNCQKQNKSPFWIFSFFQRKLNVALSFIVCSTLLIGTVYYAGNEMGLLKLDEETMLTNGGNQTNLTAEKKEEYQNVLNVATNFLINSGYSNVKDYEIESLTVKNNSWTLIFMTGLAVEVESNKNVVIKDVRDVREVVWNQLSSQQKERINGTWKEGKVSKITLSKAMMSQVKDTSYEGREVYLIDFPTKEKSLPNNMIVYADKKTFDYIGLGLVD